MSIKHNLKIFCISYSMEKISNIISKKVISLEEGQRLGYIINAIFDEDLKRFLGLVVVDDESEQAFVVEYQKIKSFSEDCVVVPSLLDLKLYIEEETNSPICKLVYDSAGLQLGRVCDVYLQGSVVRKIVTDKCEFLPRYIRKSGKNYIIFGTKSRKAKSPAKEIFENADKNLPNVFIQNVSQKVSPNLENTNNFSQTKPYRIFANQSSILGRTMQSDLYGFNNEIIAKKYDIINQNIVNRAKRHNKLNLLLYYSK